MPVVQEGYTHIYTSYRPVVQEGYTHIYTSYRPVVQEGDSHILYQRGSSQSAPEHSLSLEKSRTLTFKKSFWPPLNLVPKNRVGRGEFGFVRWQFVSTNGIQMQFLGAVSFKSSILTVYCLISWFVQQKLETYSTVCVLCRLSNLPGFHLLKYISPFFGPQVTNHNVLWKKWFLR